MGVIRHVDAGYDIAERTSRPSGACASRCARADPSPTSADRRPERPFRAASGGSSAIGRGSGGVGDVGDVGTEGAHHVVGRHGRRHPVRPAPIDTVRPVIVASATTGHAVLDPNGVIVPRSYPVTSRAVAASGIESRLTPRCARSFGHEISRSPGTSANRKSSSARRTTRVLTMSRGSTPRAAAPPRGSPPARAGSRRSRCRMPSARPSRAPHHSRSSPQRRAEPNVWAPRQSPGTCDPTGPSRRGQMDPCPRRRCTAGPPPASGACGATSRRSAATAHRRLPPLRLDPRGRRPAGVVRRRVRRPRARPHHRPEGQPVGLVGRPGCRRGRRDPGVVIGSHLDSVPDGGAFDGPLGRRRRPRGARRAAASAASRRPGRSGVVDFADEEGARFGVACAGSRLITGALGADRARGLRDRDGVTLAEAMRRGRPRPGHARPRRRDAATGSATFVELHVEQGRGLVDLGHAGRRRHRRSGRTAAGGSTSPARPTTPAPRAGGPRRTRCSPGRDDRRWPRRRRRRRTARRDLRPGARSSRTGSTPSPSPGHRLARRPRRRRRRRAAGVVAEVRERRSADRDGLVTEESVDPDRPPSTPALVRRMAGRGSAALPVIGDRRRARRRHPRRRRRAAPRCCSSATRPGSRTRPTSTPSRRLPGRRRRRWPTSSTRPRRGSSMTTYWCEHALLPGGSAPTGAGRRRRRPHRSTCTPDAPAGPATPGCAGVVLPGLANAHCHAFHRALRGRTHDERRHLLDLARADVRRGAPRSTPTPTSRWPAPSTPRWRSPGSPPSASSTTCTTRPDGTPLRRPERDGRGAASARRARPGIRITLLDTCYLAGGLSRRSPPLDGVQLRFCDGDARGLGRAGRARCSDDRHGPGRRRDALGARGAARRSSARWSTARRADARCTCTSPSSPPRTHACLAALRLHPDRAARRGGRARARDHRGARHPPDRRRHRACSVSAGTSACFCPTTERDLADGIGPAAPAARRGRPLALGLATARGHRPVRGGARRSRCTSGWPPGERGHGSPRPSCSASATCDGHARARLARRRADRRRAPGRPGRACGLDSLRTAGRRPDARLPSSPRPPPTSPTSSSPASTVVARRPAPARATSVGMLADAIAAVRVTPGRSRRTASDRAGHRHRRARHQTTRRRHRTATRRSALSSASRRRRRRRRTAGSPGSGRPAPRPRPTARVDVGGRAVVPGLRRQPQPPGLRRRPGRRVRRPDGGRAATTAAASAPRSPPPGPRPTTQLRGHAAPAGRRDARARAPRPSRSRAATA